MGKELLHAHPAVMFVGFTARWQETAHLPLWRYSLSGLLLVEVNCVCIGYDDKFLAHGNHRIIAMVHFADESCRGQRERASPRLIGFAGSIGFVDAAFAWSSWRSFVPFLFVRVIRAFVRRADVFRQFQLIVEIQLAVGDWFARRCLSPGLRLALAVWPRLWLPLSLRQTRRRAGKFDRQQSQ